MASHGEYAELALLEILSTAMKIVFVQTYELFPDSRLSRELDLLTDGCHDISVILWQRTLDGAFIRDYPGVRVERVTVPAPRTMGGRQQLSQQPRFQRAVYGKLLELCPNLIIAHNLDALPSTVLYRLLHGTPLIYVARENYTKVVRIKTGSVLGELAGWLTEAALAHCSSSVITVTPRLVGHFRRMGIQATMVPNAPNRRFIDASPQKTQRDDITLGFVGNLRPNCGVEEMWQALGLLNREPGPRYHMLLCGFPLAGFEDTIAQMRQEAPDCLTVIPTVLPNDVPSLYRDIDIAFQLLYPTPKYRDAALSVKVYEALASATPVVIYNTGEDPAFLADVDAAIVLNSHEPATIAAAVRLLGENPTLRHEMGLRGRRFIESKFNWDLFSQRYLRLIHEVT